MTRRKNGGEKRRNKKERKHERTKTKDGEEGRKRM